MSKFWEKFYGKKNPYSPVDRFEYWPAILTISWWRWCLKPRCFARERIRLYYIRRIKYRVLRYPLCWVLGHNKYETVDWSYNATMCSRCHRTLRYQSHSSK